jgi:hypothetical protein
MSESRIYDMNAKEIAKIIKSSIKMRYPKMKVSVRTRDRQAIDIIIKNCDFNPINFDRNQPNCNEYSTRAKDLIKDLEEMGNRAINDYCSRNFYLSVAFDLEFEEKMIERKMRILGEPLAF